jgi:hypothetical protein
MSLGPVRFHHIIARSKAADEGYLQISIVAANILDSRQGVAIMVETESEAANFLY